MMKIPGLYKIKEEFKLVKNRIVLHIVQPGEYIFVIKSLQNADWGGFSCLVMYKDFIGKKHFPWKYESLLDVDEFDNRNKNEKEHEISSSQME